MVQLTRLAAPLLNSAPPRPELPSPPRAPFPPMSINGPPPPPAPPAPPVTTLLANVLRVTHNEPKLQIAAPFALPPVPPGIAVHIGTRCRLSARTAAAARCSIAAKSGPIGRQRALVEDRPAGTFAARPARVIAPGRTAVPRRSRNCPPRYRDPASPCRYCEWRHPQPGSPGPGTG